LRKLIRFSAAAFLVWAVTTFAWAAISHVTGVTGPARASGASLNFVADAVTFLDPPGVLGAPQRLAARQLRQVARTVERIHQGPERMTAQLMDEMGHRRCHVRHGHRHMHEVRIERDGHAVLAPIAPLHLIDELDDVRAHAEAQAVIDLQERQRERIEQSVERLRERLEAMGAGQESELSPRVRERLREILRRLERELGNAEVEATSTELENVRIDAPVRIRIRSR